jgi:hypothetical protein
MIEQRLTDAVLGSNHAGSKPNFWQNLLLAIADADAALATGSGSASWNPFGTAARMGERC